MNKVISNLVSGARKGAAATVKKAKAFVVNPRMGMLSMMLLFVSVSTFAQDVDAGLAAIETSTESLKRYVPVVTNLCYAIAGIVAMIGAISVYVKMNNEEQDVKNILVLQNRQETRRKEMKLNSLLHNTLCRYFNFPIFENVVLKNI
ncbi:DUF4134 family protein [Segatella copri]|uniref:DUF4134 family protein n=1 Tax=Segatella copri TaxID=165179 RepID=UPI002FF0B19B